MKTIDLANVTKFDANEIWATIDEEQRKKRTRTLEEKEVRTYVARMNRALKVILDHKLEPHRLIGRLDAGGVSNGYGYPAETSGIHLVGGQLRYGRLNCLANTVRKDLKIRTTKKLREEFGIVEQY